MQPEGCIHSNPTELLKAIGAKLGLRHPIGFNNKQLFRLHRIIGAQVDPELMRAIHTRMHHVVEDNGRFFTGIDCRRTDDSLGRSAALQYFNGRLA